MFQFLKDIKALLKANAHQRNLNQKFLEAHALSVQTADLLVKRLKILERDTVEVVQSNAADGDAVLTEEERQG